MEHYQHLLNDTLEEKATFYRPTLLLQQSIDYCNWEAASIIYRKLGDFSAEIRCLSRALRNRVPFNNQTASYQLLARHEDILKSSAELSPEESAHILFILAHFWDEYALDQSILEEHIINFIPQLAAGIRLLMDNKELTSLPFSTTILLQTTSHYLSSITKNQRNGNYFHCFYLTPFIK